MRYDRKKHSDFLFSTFSSAAGRRGATCSCKFDTVYDAFAALRQHTVDDPMCRGSVSSVCMHSGDLFADQTTSSMVVELTNEIKIWVTGSSRPCLSLFKPYGFKAGGIINVEGAENPDAYWRKQELRQRKLLGKIIPDEYRNERDAIEKKLTEEPSVDGLSLEEIFFDKWKNYPFDQGKTSASFRRFWDKKNRAL